MRLLAWFFLAQMTWNGAVTVVGPFDQKKDCEAGEKKIQSIGGVVIPCWWHSQRTEPARP